MQSQRRHTPIFSMEFFPPKNEEGAEKLRQTRDELAALGPRFFSVTYGAGGSTRDRTLGTVREIKNAGYEAVPHLSCIGSTRESIREILAEYRSVGVRHIVALRGDLPSGTHEVGELRYANDLVAFIREESGNYFHIDVAAYPEFHPQSPSATADLENFRRKVEAGANGAITQYFYNLDSYVRFVESCERMGLNIPIVPGIMPITNFTQLARFSDLCGTEIPRWLRRRLEGYGNDLESIRALGLDVVTQLCQRLLEVGAPGLHFYTMNQSGTIRALWKALDLGKS